MADSILNVVAGYQAACARKQALAESGSDFQSLRFSVANTVGQLHPKRLVMKVVSVQDETASTRTLRLQPEAADAALPPFQAGQYVNVYVQAKGTHTARPYAIASSPQQHEE